MAVKLFAARNFIIGANVQVYRHSTDLFKSNAPNVIDVIADVLHYFIDLFLRTANRESAVNKAFFLHGISPLRVVSPLTADGGGCLRVPSL